MTNPRFIQIHSLVGYPAVLLNRDENGAAKRLSFGGSSRIRISSQSLKRHWRVVEDDWAIRNISDQISTRSRDIIEKRILPDLIAAAASEEIAEVVALELTLAVYGKKGADRKSRQALLLGKAEIDHLRTVGLEAVAGAADVDTASAAIKKMVSEGKATLSQIAKQAGDIPAGIEAALFGRMVTSDKAANTDAAIHVSHALSVHAEEVESDYFTVVDDLETDSGSGGIFDSELTSSLFYGYVVVDIEALVKNLGDDRTLAAKVVEHLVHLIATVSPGAKKGSTAPYSYADLLLVETGSRQPRTLANAFRKAVSLKTNDLTERSIAALSSHLSSLDTAYGAHENRALLSISGDTLPGTKDPVSLIDLAKFAAAAVGE